MENTDLILIKDEGVYLEKHKRRGKIDGFRRLLFYLLALILLASIVTCAIFLLPKSKDLFEGINIGDILTPNDKSPSEVLGSENTQKPPEQNPSGTQSSTQSIPTGAYKITSKTNEYKITNETEIELSNSTPQLVSPIEIKAKYGSEAPLVLITHFNPSESYSNGKYYTENDDFYSDVDNVASLAELMTKTLNDIGIKALYLDEEYAKGSVFGTLDEYEKSLAKMLERYPSISYVFCISRGIYINDDMTQSREYTSTGGENCAQIRIISGTSGDKMTEAQSENVAFALDFAKFANEKIDSFVAESKIAPFFLAQNVTPLACMIELGTYGSTYDEAKASTVLLSELIFEYLSGASLTKNPD